ncbi:Polyamine-modulated factor [Dirofilaria immitis]
MSTESLYAAVNEVLKKLVGEAIAAEKCVKIIDRTTKKKIDSERMDEILATAKEELQESVLEGVSRVIHNDEVLEGMIKLKNLIEESPKEVKGWRPSGIPSNDITGHLQPVMTNIEKNLIQLRTKLEAEIDKKRIFYKETESRAQALMREAPFCNHIIHSLP